ncbi:MAG: HlyC/CorC family transporter [Candidatus Pacebacteria bacterium]|nr:HlyC/CorC family transporter [Candidatus Paceibacterota bacterium]
MTQLLTSIFLVVIASALCSCLEAAFFSISQSTVEVLKEEKRRGSAALYKIKTHVNRTILTLVVLSNVVTIVGSIYVGHIATERFGDARLGIVSALLTVLVIFFGEVAPKVIGQNYARQISLAFAPILYVVTVAFTPLVFIVEFLTNRFTKKPKLVSEEELRMLTRMGEEEGSIEQDEHEIIQRVFTLNDLTAKDIMTPRTVVEALPVSATLREVSVIILHKPYSRYPVFDESLDTIVGFVQTSTLLTALANDDDNELVSHFMTAPLFVSEKKRVDDLMALFLSKRRHIAIVQDEFGGTTGVVTFEDVMEQLVGEIVDETDEVVDLRSHARATHTAKQK